MAIGVKSTFIFNHNDEKIQSGRMAKILVNEYISNSEYGFQSGKFIHSKIDC